MTTCCEDEIITDARVAAEEILAHYYRIDLRKALNPLNPHDFVTITRTIASTIRGKVDPAETRALLRAVDALDVDWNNLPKEARWKLIDHVRHTYFDPLPAQVLPAVQQTLSFHAKDLVTTTKSAAIKKFDLNVSPDLNAFDERVAKYAANSQGHFVRDEFGRRNEAFGARARAIVEGGLREGLGSGDIAAKLHGDLGELRSRGYWDMVAMVFANRARTMAQVGSFHEAGIEDYQWESVMDEVTSVQCRFLHGRIFPVQGAMSHFQSVEDEESNPEAIKTLTPFMNFGKIDGKPSLYVGRQSENPVTVAHVTHNAVGLKDEPGSFANGKDDKELLALGVSAPPIHGRCRSTIIPLFN